MTSSTSAHPLDSLSAEEIELASILTKEKLSEGAAFCSASLVEPSKQALAGNGDSQIGSRRVKLNGFEYDSSSLDGGFESIVDLQSKEVQLRRIEEGQAPIGLADVMMAIGIIKQDPEWQEAMRKRGVTNFDLVQIDPWPAGGYQHPSIPQGHRAHRGISFVRESATDNGYAHPVQGLIAHVDLTAGKVAHLEDHGGVVPFPRNRASTWPRTCLNFNSH